MSTVQGHLNITWKGEVEHRGTVRHIHHFLFYTFVLPSAANQRNTWSMLEGQAGLVLAKAPEIHRIPAVHSISELISQVLSLVIHYTHEFTINGNIHF